MKQVRLQRGNQHIIGWIEERGARLGAKVELLLDKAFWTVVEVFDFAMAAERVREHENRARGSFTALKSYRGSK